MNNRLTHGENTIMYMLGTNWNGMSFDAFNALLYGVLNDACTYDSYITINDIISITRELDFLLDIKEINELT